MSRAGRPMVAVFLHGDIGEIVAVGSSWYGLGKLGTGGLARAYAQGVSHGSVPFDGQAKGRARMNEASAGPVWARACRRPDIAG